MANLKEEFVEKYSTLVAPTDFIHSCIECCGPKNHTSLGRFDAAQFFKAACVERGIAKMKQLLQRIRFQTGKDAVAIKRFGRSDCDLCAATKRPNSQIDVIPFGLIASVFEIIKHDASFTIGARDVRARHVGWPMGGSFSEPATLCDLNDCVRLFFLRSKWKKKCHWYHRDFATQQLLFGMQHVDDCLLCLHSLCTECLMNGITALFPQDVGMSLEAEGVAIRFLHSVVNVAWPGQPVVTPYFPNTEFAIGIEPSQKFCRLGKYFCAEITTKFALRFYLYGQLLSIDRITLSHLHHAWPVFLLVLSEVYCSGLKNGSAQF